MDKFIILIIMLTLSSGCVRNRNSNNIERKETQQADCRAKELCSELDEYEKKCRQTLKESDCKYFVNIFIKLSPVSGCKRHFDHQSVPSVWVCDELLKGDPAIHDRSVSTLSKLKFGFAKKFYSSPLFRSTLDGVLAEEHLPLEE